MSGLNACQMNIQVKNNVMINTLYWNLRVGSLIPRQSRLCVANIRNLLENQLEIF